MNLIISYMIISFFFLIDFLILVFGLFFFLAIIKGAPYVPVKRKALSKIIAFADIKPGQKAADIGSGDGRIVIALAKAGAIACGYEINPVLVWWSRREIRKAGLSDKAFIYFRNLWSEDFSPFDVVAIFGIPRIMKKLGEKLDKELKPGAKIISYGFSFPDWQPIKKEDEVFLYEKK